MRMYAMTMLRVLLFVAAAGIISVSALADSQPPAAQSAPTQTAPGVQPPAGRGQGAGRGGAVRSPEVGADRRITFRLRAPNAKEAAVTIGGSRLAMQKDDQGVWSVTSEPMAPDIYTYAMVVDGTTIPDPSNRRFQTSFGSHQTMVAVHARHVVLQDRAPERQDQLPVARRDVQRVQQSPVAEPEHERDLAALRERDGDPVQRSAVRPACV